jgi:Methyltransferase domain
MPASVQQLCRCPSCLGELSWSGEILCSTCGTRYGIVGDVPLLLVHGEEAPASEEAWNAGAKRLLPRRYWPLTDRVRRYVRPDLTYKTARSRALVFEFAKSFPPEATLLNIGAGETEIAPNVINLDIAPFSNVDVVAVAEQLPLANRSFEGVMLIAVLEHVRDADRTLKEVRRVLAPGGRVLIDVPFIQGYHAAPRDNRRYTEQGLRAELERYGFDIEASGVAVGPASAMAWITSEFLALLLSFRSASAYRLLRLATSWLSWPLKFADLWLAGHPMAYTMAGGVWVTAKLPTDAPPVAA